AHRRRSVRESVARGAVEFTGNLIEPLRPPSLKHLDHAQVFKRGRLQNVGDGIAAPELSTHVPSDFCQGSFLNFGIDVERGARIHELRKLLEPRRLKFVERSGGPFDTVETPNRLLSFHDTKSKL